MQALTISPVAAPQNGSKGQDPQSKPDKESSFEEAFDTAGSDATNADQTSSTETTKVAQAEDVESVPEEELVDTEEGVTQEIADVLVEDPVVQAAPLPTVKTGADTPATPSTRPDASTGVQPVSLGIELPKTAATYAVNLGSPIPTEAQPKVASSVAVPTEKATKTPQSVLTQMVDGVPQEAKADKTQQSAKEVLLQSQGLRTEAVNSEKLVATAIVQSTTQGVQTPAQSFVGQFQLQPQTGDTTSRRFELKWPTDPRAPTQPPQSNAAQLSVQIRPATPIQTIIQAETSKAQAVSFDAAQSEALSQPESNRPRTESNPVNFQTMNIAQTRADLSAGVARQIAIMMQRAPERSLELSLSPAELGSVRLKMTPAEAGIAVSVMAERPETLDLLRRNIDSLQQAMSDIGYSDIAFSFDLGSEATQDETHDDAAPENTRGLELLQEDAPVETKPSHRAPPLYAPGAGLDVRV